MDPESLYRQYGMPRKISAGERGVQPKFVKLAEVDRGEFLPDSIFEDPHTFQPKPGPLGQIHAWGLFSYDHPETMDNGEPIPQDTKNWAAFDGVQNMLRHMSHEMTYRGTHGISVSPEKQFVDVLMNKKKEQLKDYDFKGLDKCDVICKITMSGIHNKEGNHAIWRRFKVSAGLSIQDLQNKVIAPVMGWVRNFHCYVFTDFRDGSLFGPEDASSVDAMHIAYVGYDYLRDNKYKFAHLFSKEGDDVGYLYDFGDRWYHNIKIEKIFSPEESSGAFELIEGEGMCPGEDMGGNIQYADFLAQYTKAEYTIQAKMKREIIESPNYRPFGKPPALFDPFGFDGEATRKRVLDAMSGPSNTKSHSAIMKPDVDSSEFWQETRSKMKDGLGVTSCAACGRSASEDMTLKTCAGCRKIMYCSVDHQREHWKAVHKHNCTREFLSK